MYVCVPAYCMFLLVCVNKYIKNIYVHTYIRQYKNMCMSVSVSVSVSVSASMFVSVSASMSVSVSVSVCLL